MNFSTDMCKYLDTCYSKGKCGKCRGIRPLSDQERERELKRLHTHFSKIDPNTKHVFNNMEAENVA